MMMRRNIISNLEHYSNRIDSRVEHNILVPIWNNKMHLQQ